MNWQPYEDSDLERMWRAGVPVAEIAAALGRSKNSVIGRAYRIDLPQHVRSKLLLPADMSEDWEAYQAGAASLVDIGAKYGATGAAVWQRFHREGWPVRSVSEANRVGWRQQREAAE